MHTSTVRRDSRKSSNTYTCIHQQLIDGARETYIDYVPLSTKMDLFSNYLLRLLVQTDVNQPHNYIPHYQFETSNGPTRLIETRLQNHAVPFAQVDANLIAQSFKAGKANNLGSIILLNIITNTPIDSRYLYLVRSRVTGEFYFTQKLCKSSLSPSQKDCAIISSDQTNLKEIILGIMPRSFYEPNLTWWLETTLLQNAEQLGQVHVDYERALADEIFVTMFRLYLTPKAFIELLLDYCFKKQPEGPNYVTLVKQHIFETINKCQNLFSTKFFLAGHISGERLWQLYLTYFDNIRQFNLFPIFPVANDQLNLMECQTLEKMLDTKCLSESTYYDALNRCFDLVAAQLSDVFRNKDHFLWKTLIRISVYLLENDIQSYQINFSENNLCLLIKSIEFHHTALSMMLLSHLSKQETLLTTAQQPLSTRVCEKIKHPAWLNYGLLDVACAVDNIIVKVCLSTHGAKPLTTMHRQPGRYQNISRSGSDLNSFWDLSGTIPSETMDSSASQATCFQGKTRERTKSYVDLSDMIPAPPFSSSLQSNLESPSSATQDKTPLKQNRARRYSFG